MDHRASSRDNPSTVMGRRLRVHIKIRASRVAHRSTVHSAFQGQRSTKITILIRRRERDAMHARTRTRGLVNPCISDLD